MATIKKIDSQTTAFLEIQRWKKPIESVNGVSARKEKKKEDSDCRKYETFAPQKLSETIFS